MPWLPWMHDSDLIDLVMLLRYGRVSGNKRETPILNMASIAKCVGLSPTHVTRLLEVGCHKVVTSDKSDMRLWRKLNNQHLYHITHPETLKA